MTRRGRQLTSLLIFTVSILMSSLTAFAVAQTELPPVPANRMVVLQAYWWDCKNERYSGGDKGGWYTYLAGLTPRLREMGINAIYLPSPCKGNSGGFSMGYDPYDHYDLGIKNQKGTVATKFGTQDELLRLIAVAHANGIQVIFDIVLNHCNGDDGDLVFKYRGFGANRIGRWPKSPEDFHGNSQHSPGGDEWRQGLFGPDICYRGPCKNNPSSPDTSTYMRDQAQGWMRWLTRQTGVDGFRFDAVKHYPPNVVNAVLKKAKPGNDPYFAVGEYPVGRNEKDRIDRWSDDTGNLSGTLDFALREVLLELSRSKGFDFDLGSLPAAQQSNRRKTAPFINNHDTWRGRYWDSADKGSDLHDDRTGDFGFIEHPHPFSELLPSIDIDLPRTRLAYAFIMAVDGAPIVYYEDLLVNNRLVRSEDPLPAGDPGLLQDPMTDDGTTRYKPDPTKIIARDWLRDLIQARRVLQFAKGRYLVPHVSPDVLVVEREGRALIALNDNEASDLEVEVATQFVNKTLKAYAGRAVAATITTNAEGKVKFRVPKGNFVVYGPEGLTAGAPLTAAPLTTTQTFEFADDLGDDRSGTPGYGGTLDSNKLHQAGAIYAAKDSTVVVELKTAAARAVKLQIFKPTADGRKVDPNAADAESIEASGNAGPDRAVTHSFTAMREGYYLLSAVLAEATAEKSNAVITATYTGPVTSDKFDPQ